MPDEKTPVAPAGFGANPPASKDKPVVVPAPALVTKNDGNDTPEKDRAQADQGAKRAELAQREERARVERRTSDPTSPDYDPELAIEELWPGMAREHL